MRLCVLVAAFCLLTSPGLAAFPDTTHNVGVGEILAPRGSVDSGVPLAPRIIVNNYGTATESLSVAMAIPGPFPYLDSLWLHALPGRSCDTVELQPYVPSVRDSSVATAWTRCVADTFPADDTARERFLIRVLDVAVVGIGTPGDTLDSGAVVYPDAWIWNYGNQVVSLPVKFHIGGWVSYVDVNNLIPGAQRLAVSPDPYVAYPGTHRVMVAALLLGDLRPEDNVREHTLQVPGLVTPGVEVVSIDAPLGRIDTFTTVPPRATIHNYGVRSETCRVWFYVENAVDSIVYCESLCMTMAAGARLTLDFPPTRFHDLGWHVSTCSVHCRPSQVEPDDVLSDSFLVLAQLTGDLGITQLLVPYDTIDTMIPQSMTVGVHNYSCTEACSGTVWIAVADTLGETVVYRESVAFLLQAGETRRLDLPTHRFTTLGRHDAELGLRAWRGPTDTLRWSFWVVLRLGVAEGPRPSALHLPPATLIRGVLYLGAGTVPGRGLSRALLLDATGRAVMALKPGPNDVRRLPAGVYFVRHSGTVPTGQGTIPIRARVLLAR